MTVSIFHVLRLDIENCLWRPSEQGSMTSVLTMLPDFVWKNLLAGGESPEYSLLGMYLDCSHWLLVKTGPPPGEERMGNWFRGKEVT